MSEGSISLPVHSAKEIASRQVLLTLDATGTSLPHAHTAPGQYARLTLEDGVARPIAIASAPSTGGHFEFLLKVPPERNAALASLENVMMSPPQGKGFPLEAARGKSLWMFAVGSGVAPLRAVVEHLISRRHEVNDVTLLYGVRHENELAFQSRFGMWAGHDIHVQPVVSRPETWKGRTGHIQAHLPKTLPSDAVAFLCGLPQMDRDVSAALLERGVGPEQVFRNW